MKNSLFLSLAIIFSLESLAQTALQPGQIESVQESSVSEYGLWTPGVFELRSSENVPQSMLKVENISPVYNQPMVHFIRSGPTTSLQVENYGTGTSGAFYSNNSLNTNPTLLSSSSSSGNALTLQSIGSGSALEAFINNLSSSKPVIDVYSNGTGSLLDLWQAGSGYGVTLRINSDSSTAHGFDLKHLGKGYGLYVSSENEQNNRDAIYGIASGSGAGVAGLNTMNGPAGKFSILSNSNSHSALLAETTGTGSAGTFENQNLNNHSPALRAISNGIGPAFRATNSGSGSAAHFGNANLTNTSNLIYASNLGPGSTLFAEGSSGPAITAEAKGSSYAIYAITSTSTASPGLFRINSSSSSRHTLQSENYGSGYAIFALNHGNGRGAVIQNTDPSNTNEALLVVNNGGGSAGNFMILNASNSFDALKAETNGTGNALKVNLNGSGASTTTGRNIAVFQSGGSNMARIDNTGKGYFNGGTQNSGADLAESFEVEQGIENYEPGDVLSISESSDRKVEKSSRPYSSLIAGVFATKPGVLLTEENMDADLSEQLPLGVIGVIPTKVCNEGGAIKRGDLLVSSSKTGYAMKADLQKVKTGQVLGKALQNFDGTTGLIKVLVNIH